MSRHVGRLKLGSKPTQLYVRFSIRPLGQQAYHVGKGIIRYYAAATALNNLQGLMCHKTPTDPTDLSDFRLYMHIHIHAYEIIYIYIYIYDTMLGIRCLGAGGCQSEDPFVCFGTKPTERACVRDLPRDQKQTMEGRS